MRVGVIRNDLSAPIFVADLEPVSTRNITTEAPGQTTYLSYPTVAGVEAALANASTGAGATISGTALTFNVVLSGANNVLKLKTSSAASFSTYTIAAATYTNITTLLAAINTALSGSGIRAFQGAANTVILESTTYGVNSYLANDTVANGSTANTPLNIANGSTRTMPTAATYISGVGLPGGLNVSQATVQAIGTGTATNALAPYYAAGRTPGVIDVFAQQFAETDTVIESFLKGNLKGYVASTFNPDPRKASAVTGAAIKILADDGSTTFTATVPTVSTAVNSAGTVTITGTGLGHESGNAKNSRSTVVQVTNAAGAVLYKLHQEKIESVGGSVSATSIVLPVGLVSSPVGLKVRVLFRHMASNIVTIT